MTETLKCTDTIHRMGYTIIDGKKVVQHTCVMPLDDPKNMRVSMTKLDSEMYRKNRDICRADFAVFEDAAFELQEKYLATSNM
jgi:hypothetical protein